MAFVHSENGACLVFTRIYSFEEYLATTPRNLISLVCLLFVGDRLLSKFKSSLDAREGFEF